MSDSEEEENYRLLGTPLEPIEEGDIPKKKPLGIQDQVATDKYGRRRFHGAFTGGFSAGHFNTVGTPEGWTPASFKSSRSSKDSAKSMRPEDFMDDEDMEDFGIAPSVVRAKSEYSGSRSGKKRERVNFRDGPIPGDPVLQSILAPSKDTIGVFLLMKMGWKPGQGIGPRLSKMEKRLQKKTAKLERNKLKEKVYGCAPRPDSSSEESDQSDEEIDVNTLFAPDDVEVTFAKPKSDVFGMGYSGLDRTSILSITQNDPSRQIPDTFRMMDSNRKLAIRGQAFGVGAFEEEDADIYARDDMSRYDFALETPASMKEKRRQEKVEKEKLLAITGGEDVIEGFVAAQKPPPRKKYFPPPTLPPGYEPRHRPRKSRFGPEKQNLPEIKGKKHFMDANDRSVILGEKPSAPRSKNDVEQPVSDDLLPDLPPPDPNDDLNFKPFVGDPVKQARYEKYLQLVKIGAKDAFKSLQPKSMSEWEREREQTEFEQAAKLYRPLSGMMADRFARAELPDESLDPLAPVAKSAHGVPAEMAEAAKSKMFGKLTRTIEEWAPVSLLCKRMNIPEPVNSGGKSLCEIAKEKAKPKSKFSVFDVLANSDNPFKMMEKPVAVNPPEGKSDVPVEEPQQVEELRTEEVDEVKNDIKIQFDDPAEKKDLFKAIFCDSDDEIEDDQSESKPSAILSSQPKPNEVSLHNVLRNTSPPRGIFANLAKLNDKKPDQLDKEKSLPDPASATTQKEADTNATSDELNLYGPALPQKPVFVRRPVATSKHRSSSSSSTSSSEDEWIEAGSSSSASKKKKKKEKDRRKDKKKKKHKRHKEHKRKHKTKKK